MKFILFAVTVVVVVVDDVVVVAQNGNGEFLDRFSYRDTEDRGDGFLDYGPPDWGDIVCDEQDREGLDACIAYRDKWHTGRAWDVQENYCRWCPASLGVNICGRHHQSPINLERNRGLGYWENDSIPGEGANENAKECIDVHWMKYEDSFCSLDQLVEQDAFTVERHALRITQPLTVFENDDLQLGCNKPGVGRRFGRIDFSKGFSQWWFLSHIDFHTPSEHSQEGKQYDAEIQLHHFYSVTAEEAEVSNELGTVSMFMEAYDDAPPYRYLDKVICMWRRHEYQVRTECGKEPIQGNYPGCFPLNGDRKLKERPPKPRFQTAQDLLLHNHKHRHVAATNSSFKLPKLIMEDVNWGPAEEKDWETWIQQQSQQMQSEDDLWESLHHQQNENGNGNNNNNNYDNVTDYDEAHEKFRDLLEGNEIEWFNYFPMLGVRTEYYYRYSGSQTTPPCYGNFQPNSRKETNHWRVMKDPIRIHRRQLTELQRLLKDRLAPKDDPVGSCQPDTAAKVSVSNGETVVQAARPVQYTHPAHFKVFCECKDWPSKWPEDRAWCAVEDIQERFYDKPYNFRNEGF